MRELTWFPLLESYAKTSGYGQRIDPITGGGGVVPWRGRLRRPLGIPLVAPFDGHVTRGNEPGGAGWWLWIDNGSDRFKSFHRVTGSRVTGGWVDAGQVIAYIGSTGASTGAHAHLELWEAGTRIDPTGYLDRAPLLGYPPPGGGDEMTDDDLEPDALHAEQRHRQQAGHAFDADGAVQPAGRPVHPGPPRRPPTSSPWAHPRR